MADLPIIATATGTLVASNQTNISPKVAGYATKIAFAEADVELSELQ